MPKFAFFVRDRFKLRSHTNVSSIKYELLTILTSINYTVYALNQYKEVYLLITYKQSRSSMKDTENSQ